MEDFRTEEFYNTLIFVERLQNNSLNIPDKETVNHTSTQANEQNLVRCQVTCTLFDLKVNLPTHVTVCVNITVDLSGTISANYWLFACTISAKGAKPSP
ncbi:uncharacterized protein LOC143922238 isoform X3 [Arctopsyche grandis]|uniref:uncharacterized protein LOC143920909 isoform X2 n=1 Tax=Arctopsyche grandis TaxID=121162 RepID=UPI00406DA483